MDQTINFDKSILPDMLTLLSMINKSTIVTKSPIKLSWGSIGWENERLFITIKEDLKILVPKVRKKKLTGSNKTLPGIFEE